MVPTLYACAMAAVLALAPPEDPNETTVSGLRLPQGDPHGEAVSGLRLPQGDPHGEAQSPYRTEVSVGRDHGDGLAAQRNLSRRNVGFVTAIDLEVEPGRRPADDLAGLVSRAPGVTVRSIGGLGQFSSLSIRGSTSEQVPVFLDGAPLGSGGSGLVDLSTQPLDALARVELYRGYVPIRYGAAAIGGALDLVGAVHRGPAKLWVAGGLGSYLAREARLGFAAPLGRGRASIATRFGYTGSRGDFAYFDDGGTPLLRDDDGFLRRLNADYQRLSGQLRIDARRGPLQLAHQDLAWWKLQGLPGTAAAPSPDATTRSLVVRSITRVRLAFADTGHVEWVGSAVVEQRALRDLGGQVGLAADDERALSFDGWLSPRLRAPLWRGAHLELVGELRGEWIRVDERVGDDGMTPLASGDATRTRVSLATGAELEQWLFERRWSIAAGVRVDLADSRFDVPQGAGELDDAGRDRMTLGVTPRVGTKLMLVEGLDLRGSVGRYLRQPNLSELFGDRGYVIGNEGLRPESGTKLDGGLTFERERIAGRELSVFAEVAGFATFSEDLIQWVRSGAVVRPVNVVGARVRGLEAGLSVRAFGRDLGFDLAYTLLDSRNAGPEAEQHGKPLPGRPRHSVLTRPSGGHRFEVGPRGVGLEPRGFYELEWIAGTFLDLSGRVELPPRLLHGLGASLRMADRVEFSIEGRNLANMLRAVIEPAYGPATTYPAAISDFIGFPLPGLSVWATLRVDLQFHETPKP
jgi:vitamin B12 transporter